ncbi:MAG: AtpZ/AtpI family protein [Bacteroidia bacterium]|nr:AtpZ/AtpI family protein [Bacteroidia bacterium]
MKPADENDGASRRMLARYSGMAIQMGIIIALFAFLGQWLDKKFSVQTPWFTLFGCLCGIAASFYLMFRGLGSKS